MAEWCSLERYAHVLTLEPVNGNLFEKGSLQMQLSKGFGDEVFLNPTINALILVRDKREDRKSMGAG